MSEEHIQVNLEVPEMIGIWASKQKGKSRPCVWFHPISLQPDGMKRGRKRKLSCTCKLSSSFATAITCGHQIPASLTIPHEPCGELPGLQPQTAAASNFSD